LISFGIDLLNSFARFFVFLFVSVSGRPGVLIWDIFRAHVTPAVKEHLQKHQVKAIYVPASLTWKRQPLDTHIFAVLKKKYQSYYYDRVFVENTPMKQIDIIYAYNSLMLNIDNNHIRHAA
jgi:hypothetical protein